MKKFLLIIGVFSLLFESSLLSQQKVWSLEDCIKFAIDNNIQIKQQVVQTKFQKNSLDLAKLSLLPTLNGQVSGGYTFGRALDQSSYKFYDQTLQSDYLSADGGAPVFSGLQNYHSIQKNKYLVLAGLEDLQTIKDNVALNVALAYLQILLNKELVAVTDSQLQTTLQQIEKTKKLVDAGSVAKGNLLQIEAQAASEELQLINMKNQLETSYLTLTQMLELKSPVGFEVSVPEITIDPNSLVAGNIEDIYEIASKNRSEIRSSELNLKASEYDLKYAKGGRSPQLSINYSIYTRYTYINQANNIAFNDQLKNNRSSGINLNLNIPILNGWQVNKNISNSSLRVENSKYSLEGAKKQLYKNIQQAYTDAVAALKKFNSSLKAVASSEESFRYTEQKFNVGFVTSVDYNAGKTQLLQAQSDLAQSKYEFTFKTKVLDFYKGIPISLPK